MLAEMARQSVECLVESHEGGHARVILRQPRLFDVRFELERVREIAAREEVRKTIENARRQVECLADFTRPHLPRPGAPEVISPEKPALQQILPEALRFGRTEVGVSHLGHHDERALKQEIVGQSQEDVIGFSGRVAADARAGQL